VQFAAFAEVFAYQLQELSADVSFHIFAEGWIEPYYIPSACFPGPCVCLLR
jgi:hypothetical protein